MNHSLYGATPPAEVPLEMANESLSASVPPLHSQRGPVQHRETEPSLPPTSYTSYGPPVRYYASCTTGYDEAPCRAQGFVEHYRGPRIVGHSGGGPQAPTGPAQYVSDFPVTPGPAQVENYAPSLPIRVCLCFYTMHVLVYLTWSAASGNAK
ncbi:hypothetical protein BGW80DRAFT_1372379 [Lactifluus volemus]|nr:hypothetical protein BGW80DRAFT_1372379 [Lactifluus volemus]